MRVNQIGITIYDNKPTVSANRWYENTQEKDKAKNRYKLELNFLHKGAPLKLRSSLVWPPSQLRRLSYWQENKQFYEDCAMQAENINVEIRAGRIAAQIPAMLAIPNFNESFTAQSNRRHYKWVMTEQPSCVIAVRKMISPEFFQWELQWLSKDFEQQFILAQNCRADEIPGRKGPSTRVYKPFAGPHIIPDKLITPDYSKIVKVVSTAVDEAYEEFKRRVQYLYSIQKEDEAMAVMNQFPNYTERWVKDF